MLSVFDLPTIFIDSRSQNYVKKSMNLPFLLLLFAVLFVDSNDIA